MELQADCYAGIWAHHADSARQVVESRRHRRSADRGLRRGRRHHPETRAGPREPGILHARLRRRSARSGSARATRPASCRTATLSSERDARRTQACRHRRLPVRRGSLRVLRAARKRTRVSLPHVPARHRRRVRGARRQVRPTTSRGRAARRRSSRAPISRSAASARSAARRCRSSTTPPSARMYATIGSLDHPEQRRAREAVRHREPAALGEVLRRRAGRTHRRIRRRAGIPGENAGPPVARLDCPSARNSADFSLHFPACKGSLTRRFRSSSLSSILYRHGKRRRR